MNEKEKKSITQEDLNKFAGKIDPELLEQMVKFVKAKSFEPVPPELPDFDNMTLEALKEWDKVGYIGVAEYIVTQIERYSPPIIFGIYGKWGTGKTTIMQMMKKIIDQRGDIATVWFDPWVYEDFDKELLFISLLKNIKMKVATKWCKFWRCVGKIVKWPVRILLGIILISVVGGYFIFQRLDPFSIGEPSLLIVIIAAFLWGCVELFFKKSGFGLESFYKKLYRGISREKLQKINAVEDRNSRLKRDIGKVLKRTGNKKLVLFIDDLDRCLPDRAILLLDQLKNFLEVPNVVTVLGVDNTALIEALNKRFKCEKTETEFGKRYLEKIVRDHYQLSGYVFNSLLSKHEPLVKVMKDPWVAGQIHQALGGVQDLNLRQLGRALLKFDYLYHHLFSKSVANMISGTYSTEQADWQQYLYRRYLAIDMEKAVKKESDHYDGKSSMMEAMASKEWAQATYEAVLISLWSVLLLVNEFSFPLDYEDEKVQELALNGHIPPSILNATYNLFRPWL